jgi:hypothetical protein
MNADDTFTSIFQGPSRARRAWRWFARAPRSAEPMDDRDVLLELSTLDMTVRFFEDRLQYHRRLGAKHGTVPYRAIHVARLVNHSTLMKQPATATFEATQELPKKLVLTIESRVRPLTFDFRREPTDKIRAVLVLIDRGLQH